MATNPIQQMFLSNYQIEEKDSVNYKSNINLQNNITNEEKQLKQSILSFYQKKLIHQLIKVFKIYDVSMDYINQQNMYQNESLDQQVDENDNISQAAQNDQSVHVLYEFKLQNISSYDPIDIFVKISNQYFDVLKKQITQFIFQSIPTDPHMVKYQISIVNAFFNKFNLLITDSLSVLNAYPIQTCDSVSNQIIQHFINKLVELLNHQYQNQTLRLQQNADILPNNLKECFSMLIIQAAQLSLITDDQIFDYVQINAVYQILCKADQEALLQNKINEFINRFMNIYLSDNLQNQQDSACSQDKQTEKSVFKSLHDMYDVLNKKINIQLPNVILIFLQIFQPHFCKNYKLFNKNYQAQSLIEFLYDSLIITQDSSLLQSIIHRIMSHIQQTFIQFQLNYDDIEYESLDSIYQLYKQVFGYQRIYGQEGQNETLRLLTNQHEVRNITLERFIIKQYDNYIKSYLLGKISIVQFILIYYLQDQNFYWMKSHFNTDIRKQQQTFFVNFRNLFFQSWGINLITQWFQNPCFDQQEQEIYDAINSYQANFNQQQVRETSILIFALCVDQEQVLDDIFNQLQQFMIRYGTVPQQMLDEIYSSLQKSGYLSTLINEHLQLPWYRLCNQRLLEQNIISIEQKVEERLFQFSNNNQQLQPGPSESNSKQSAQSDVNIHLQRIEGTGQIKQQQFKFVIILPISDTKDVGKQAQQITEYNTHAPQDILEQIVQYFNENRFQSFICIGLPKLQHIQTIKKSNFIQEPSITSISTTTMHTTSRHLNQSPNGDDEKEIKLQQLVLKAAISKQLKISQQCTRDDIILWGKLQDSAKFLSDQQIHNIIDELIQDNIISIESETDDNCVLIWGQK